MDGVCPFFTCALGDGLVAKELFASVGRRKRDTKIGGAIFYAAISLQQSADVHWEKFCRDKDTGMAWTIPDFSRFNSK